MKAHDLRGGSEVTIEVQPVDGAFGPIPARRDEVSLRRIDDEIVFSWAGHAFPIQGVDPRSKAELEATVERGLPFVAWIANATAKRATVAVRSFQGGLRLEQPLVIGIVESCTEELRRRFGVSGGVSEAARWLEERLLATGTDPTRRRAVVTGGPDGAAFRIFGRDVTIDVRREAEKLRIEHVLRVAPSEQTQVQLLDAPIGFADHTATGEISASARHALEEAVRETRSYLRIWSTYHGMETEAVLARARRMGALRYESFTRRPDGGFRFHLAATPDLEARLSALGEEARFELEAGNAPPDLDNLGTNAPRGGKKAQLAAKVVDFDAQQAFIDLRSPEDDDDVPLPPERGFLYLSLTGDRARLRRREIAEEKLRTGTNPMPQLGLLIEGRPAPGGTFRRRTGKSPAVLDAFDGRPTAKQITALEIALNTPDIALIQGPPGTGKTKVITALQRRLAELADEGAEVSHRILVSSAQHDAVENVVQRSDVFGLPAVKVGSRRGDDGDVFDGVEKFRIERSERLRAELRAPPEEERAARARRIAVAVVRAPAPPSQTAAQLRELLAMVVDLLPPALRDRVERRAATLGRPGVTDGDPEEHELRLAAARGIRAKAASFEDDGPVRARRALLRLARVLLPEEKQLLDACASWAEAAAPPWLDRVEAVRDALLARLQKAAEPPQPQTDTETQNLLIEVVDALETRRMRSIHGEPGVLAAYLEDLENDAAAVRHALEHYTVVLAATCQQAAGGAMRAVRGVESGWPEFETVIVDEAARANPLDLFIPMGMARRRVVLVGDHRQLPHMLEPDVERDVAAAVSRGDLAEEAETALKVSLFGRLWELLKELEARDGIPRTVRLDTQFRMHPVLGDFVSRMFYERRQEEPLLSGGAAQQFEHPLAEYTKNGKPCVAGWLDVPGGAGRSERPGRSKSRPIEAKRIAREVRSLIEQDPHLTFGVIAFYSAQVDAIGKALIHEGLAEPTDTGGWRIADRWKRTENRRGERVERLRLGSVDAFQGKEFDVVFLSVTRSNDLPESTDEERRRKYGHLVLENRLCVAMSRQQRLLVVAGDRAFATRTDALAPLRELSNLCEGPHGTVRS